MAINLKPLRNIYCPQGKTFSDVFVVGNSAGNPTDLTGYTARCEIRSRKKIDGVSLPDDEDVMHVMTTENGGIFITPESGMVRLYIDSVTTASLPKGKWWYEVELYGPPIPPSSAPFVPYLMPPSRFEVALENTL